MGVQAGAEQQQTRGGLGGNSDGLSFLGTHRPSCEERPTPLGAGLVCFHPPGWSTSAMVSAYAIRPPDHPFQSAGLKAHSRRFIERALMLAALVHLVAAGLFRAADERDARRGGQETAGIPEQVHTFNVWVPLELPPPSPPGSTGAKIGRIELVPTDPHIELPGSGFLRVANPIGPEGGPGPTVGPPGS